MVDLDTTKLKIFSSIDINKMTLIFLEALLTKGKSENLIFAF